MKHETESMVWDLKKPGHPTFESCWNEESPGDNREWYNWYEYDWNAKAVGTLTSVSTRSTGTSPPACGNSSNATIVSASAPGIASEKCGGDTRGGFESDGTFWTETVTRKTLTLYELHTGGKSGSKRKSLFVAHAAATKLYNLFYPEIDDYSPSAAIASASIQVGDLGKLDSDGYLCKALGDGETHDATPTVSSARYYAHSVGVSKYLFKSQVACAALSNPDPERTSLGVAEYVSLGFVPAIQEPVGPVTYTTTAGTIDSGGNFIAPHSAGAATVTATIRKVSLSIDFGVIEPSGISSTIRSRDGYNSSINEVGAGMQLDVTIQPTTVSFSQIAMEEPGQTAAGLTGYFTNHTPPNHDSVHGANAWHPVNCGNYVMGPPIDVFDNAWSADWPIGVSGSYTWPISPIWEVVGDTTTHPLSGWTDQVMTLSSDGTMRVDKLGHNVIRHRYETYGIAQ
jgi:hypothetical protein